MNQDILQELVDGILKVMREQLVRIVLYGSAARGTSEDKLSDFIVEMNLKYDKVFSVMDINAEKFIVWESIIPFYQNVTREGVILWQAA